MAQLMTVRLSKADQQPLGFRLQGGKDFGTPLVVQKVNGGSAAERAGLQAGDALIRVNSTDVYTMRHQEAQDAIRAAGTALELTVQRGGSTWRPTVTPTGSLPRPGSRAASSAPSPVTSTSLRATPQPHRALPTHHNNVAKPFGYMNGNENVKSIVNKQYNTPVNMYSDKTIAETLSAQSEVLAGGVLGVNFKKNEKTYDAEKSAVFKVLQEEQNDPEPEMPGGAAAPLAAGLRSVAPPQPAPLNTGGLPPGQNICEECERLITGVFVRIKDKNLHVECFKCATCGGSLKNQGYYNLNGKLYCDIHAKLVARQQPPAPHLEPVTVSPGARVPSNAFSTPLPPLSTNSYTNGSSSMFSPSSNVSGPKPFGSSLGSAYSPGASLSPRSAPLSPARPLNPAAPAPPPAHFAPTKSVKNVVWPPQNPPEDEMSKISHERNDKENAKRIVNSSKDLITTVSNKCSTENAIQEFSAQHNVVEKAVSTSHQTTESFVSNTSHASVTASTAAALSSELVSKKSQEIHETSCIVQSFTEQKSESQSLTMYESQTSIPQQKSFESLTLEKAPISDQSIILKESKIEHSENNENTLVSTAETTKAQQRATKHDNKSEQTTQCPKTQEFQEELQQPSTTPNNALQMVEKDHAKENTQASNLNESTLTSVLEIGKLDTSNNISETTLEHCYLKESKLSSVKQLPPSKIPNSVPRAFMGSMVDALTTASDRPYSPLPTTSLPAETSNTIDNKKSCIPEVPKQPPYAAPSPIFTQQPKRGITPINPIKPYNPPEKKEPAIPMPTETTPYIPPDFKIIIEPKIPREAAASPMVEALTTAPDRPFTPTSHSNQNIERGSLKDALTIAPDRSYTPIPSNITSQSSHISTSVQSSTVQVQSTSMQILRPIATQTTTQMSEQMHTGISSMQNTCQLQSSSDVSAFRPVAKQVFPPPQPEDFCKLDSFPPISNELKTSFQKFTRAKQETDLSESQSIQNSTVTTSSMNTQSFSSVKVAQSYFEQLDQKESFSSTAVRSKSGLHKPDSIPTYQKKFDQLLSQRGITPEVCNAPAVLQRPVTPSTDPPMKPREKSQEPNSINAPPKQMFVEPPMKTPSQQPTVYFHKDTPISMTFQPVTDENLLRASPARSRPTTPSLINKPAPIIPHYQMNLVTVEHNPAETNLYNPSSPEPSRSPTPKLRSRSPAQGPPPNPLKAQAPRIKENTPQRIAANTLLTQATSNLRKEHDMAQRGFQSNLEVFNASGAKNWAHDQPSIVKEQRSSIVGYTTENFEQSDLKIKQDSTLNQNYGKRQTQSQNVTEVGNTIVQSSRKTFEEFEKTQSAKIIEIRKGGSMSSGTYNQSDSNIRPSAINPKQVFPPPIMSVSTCQQSSSVNFSNQNATSISLETSGQQNPHTGANKIPVCDPTPSTGSGLGAVGRGKTFGVSSAPKRGRGVLNKAAMPGSRVPLCASCNGNIRGPFITALGRIWCPEHFMCVNATCRRPLQDIGFVEENGQLYCEYCFEQYIAPACDKCHAKIKGDSLNAIGKHFHPECFNCVYCGKLFGNNPFFLEDGLPYCEADWNELFTTKCFACGFPVEAGDRWVEALNNNYHSQCFNCTVCKKNLEGQSFFAKGGRPFCKMHAR